MNLSTAIENNRVQLAKLPDEEKRSMQKYLNVISEFFGDIQVDEIMPVDIEYFMSFIKTKYIPLHAKHSVKPTDTTLEKWLEILRRLLVSVTGGKLHSEIKNILQGKENDCIHPYSKDELALILGFSMGAISTECDLKYIHEGKEGIYGSVPILLHTLIDTGMRPSEISRMRFRDIDNDKGEVIIHSAGTASNSSQRTVAIGRKTRAEIWSFFTQNQFAFDNLIFDLDTQEIRLQLDQVGDFLGVHECSPDRCRKSYIALSSLAGNNHYAIEHALGLSTIKIIPPWMEESDEEFRKRSQQSSVVDNMQIHKRRPE
jgi:integrase